MNSYRNNLKLQAGLTNSRETPFHFNSLERTSRESAATASLLCSFNCTHWPEIFGRSLPSIPAVGELDIDKEDALELEHVASWRFRDFRTLMANHVRASIVNPATRGEALSLSRLHRRRLGEYHPDAIIGRSDELTEIGTSASNISVEKSAGIDVHRLDRASAAWQQGGHPRQERSLGDINEALMPAPDHD